MPGSRALDAERWDKPRAVILRSINASRDATGSDNTSRLLGRLAGVAIVVLLISCANAANLLLARAMRRRREIAVRLALGGARARIVRLLVVESVMLGMAGGAAAALAGYWTGEGLRRLLFPDGRWTTAAFDDRTLVFTLILALAAGLVAGLAPALQLTNPDLVTALKDNRHQPGRRSHLHAGDARRPADGVLDGAADRFRIARAKHAKAQRGEHRIRTRGTCDHRNLNPSHSRCSTHRCRREAPRERIGRPRANSTTSQRARRRARVAGAVRVAAVDEVSVPGQPEPVIAPQNGPFYFSVSPNYFSVMGTRLLRGRVFTAGDSRGVAGRGRQRDDGAAVLAGEGTVRHVPFAAAATCAQVVGVVEDIRDTRGGSAPRRGTICR